MKPAATLILTINGGSSSIKYALFEAGGSLQRIQEWSQSGGGASRQIRGYEHGFHSDYRAADEIPGPAVSIPD